MYVTGIRYLQHPESLMLQNTLKRANKCNEPIQAKARFLFLNFMPKDLQH